MDGSSSLNDASKLSNVALEDVSPRLELLAHHLQHPPTLIAPSCRPEDEVVSHGYPNLELRFLSLPALTLKESSRYISDHLDLTSLAHRLLSHPPRHLDSSPAWGGGEPSLLTKLCAPRPWQAPLHCLVPGRSPTAGPASTSSWPQTMPPPSTGLTQAMAVFAAAPL